MQKSDLHIHSTFSDGKLNISEILDILEKKDIKNFSITDHDNIDSIKEIKKYNLKNLHYISGVEISSYFEHYGIHILGYYIDSNIAPMKKLLYKINQKRKKRMKEILKKLKIRDGIVINHDDFDELMNSNNIGKKNLAKILMRNNMGDNYLEIRKKYLTNLHCKTSYRVNIKKVCKTIKKCGGVAVLAHPKEYELRFNLKLENIIEKLIESGIEGIEVYHSIHSKEDIERYLNIAKKYNLKISGGSDFHNANMQEIGLLSKDKNTKYENFSIIKD